MVVPLRSVSFCIPRRWSPDRLPRRGPVFFFFSFFFLLRSKFSAFFFFLEGRRKVTRRGREMKEKEWA